MYLLHKMFIGIAAVNIIILLFAVHTIVEPFSLVMDPFSWLGKFTAANGLTNSIAFSLFCVTMLYNAYAWKRFMSLLMQTLKEPHLVMKIIRQMVPFGFILMAFPCDKFNVLHSIGSGFVVGGLWAFIAYLLYCLKGKINFFSHLGLQLLLHITALYCGVSFYLDTALKGFSQRPLLLAIIINLSVLLRTLHRIKVEDKKLCDPC